MMVVNSSLLAIYATLLHVGNYQMFYNGESLLLRIRKRQSCVLIPYEFHPLIDPGNTRMNISDNFFQMVQNHCSFNETQFVLNVFLRRSSKWCGSKGDEAVENCCSKRARCPMKLKRMKTKGNAKNKNPFTINACDCEKSFATCLKKVDNKEAKKVLKYHFEIFSGTCIIYDNPYTYSEDSKTPKTCIKNTKKPKKWLIRKMYHLR